MTQLDIFAARDQALAQVSDNSGSFMDEAFNAVMRMPPGEYTGEDIRLALEARGIEPHHPNAWGALTLKCVRAGILTGTGKRAHMKSPKSHARKTDVYRKG